MKALRNELQGEVVRTVDLPHFLLTETRYVRGMHLAKHGHPNGYLSIVLEGAYRELHQSRSEECFTGSLIYHPPQEVHENFFSSMDSRCLNFHFLFDESSLDVNLQKRFHCPRGAAADLVRNIYREFCRPDSMSPLIMDGLGLALLGEVLRLGSHAQRIPGWLRQTEEQIQNDFQQRFTITSLARTAGVHPVHLSRTFRKHYHCTIGEYVRSLRVDYASGRLRSTSLDLAEIALETGFSDQSTFSKTFKRVTGFTPAQFRKRFRPR